MTIFITYLKKISVLFLVVTFISGCASGSKSIEAAYVSPLQYQSYDCNQIGQEMYRVGRKVSEVSGQQDSVAGKDAAMMGVGLVVFWPALFFLAAGEDRKEELARLKGEADALEKSAINKQCTQVLAQIAKEKQLHEEKEVDKDLVEKRRNECIDTLGDVSACSSDLIEKELRVEKEAKISTQTVQQEVPQKETTSFQNLVKIEMQECLDKINPIDCRIEDMEEKVRTEQENKKKSETATSDIQAQLSLDNEFTDIKAQPSSSGKPENETHEAHVYKAKCLHCGNVVSYKEKYSGSLTKCMQCDHEFELP